MAADDVRSVGVERLLFLRSLSIARHEGPEAVKIAAAMRDVHFARGRELFAIGDASGEVFFLVKGSVQMTAPGTPPWVFVAPAVVGALDSFAGRPRTRRGVATSETHALVLSHGDWLAVLEEHTDFAREVLLGLARMLGRMCLAVPGDGGFRGAPARAGGSAPRALGLFDRTVALRRLPLFSAAGVEATVRLAGLAEEIALAPGDVLFREGDPCDALDVVVGGVIEAARAAPPLEAAFGPGAIVGGASVIALSTQPFGAHAPLGAHARDEGATVLRMRKDDVLDVMEDHFELTRAMLSAINAERDDLMGRHGVIEP
jgi:CRP-like cAMP-binding protein